MILLQSKRNEECKDVILQKDKINKINEEIVKVIKNGLPKEAQTIEVLNFILEECKNYITRIPLDLE